MSTLNNIIKKISVKEELSKYQVELALVDDAKKVIDTANLYIDKIDQAETLLNSSVDRYNKLREDFIKSDSMMLSASNNLSKAVNEINALLNNFKKMSTDLGINVNDIKEFKILEQTLKNALVYQEGSQSMSKEIRKYIK